MISEFQWLAAHSSQCNERQSFERLKKAFEEDPIAYAVYCSCHNIMPVQQFSSYELDVIDFYHQDPSIQDSFWVDMTLSNPSVSSKKSDSQKKQLLEQLREYTEKILGDQSAIRPVVLTSDQVRTIYESQQVLAADSFYHKFFSQFLDRPFQYWIEREYHETFDQVLKTHNLKNPKLLQELLMQAVYKGSLPIIQSLVRALDSSIALDPHLLYLAIASEEPAVVQFIINLGIPPSQLHCVQALDCSPSSVLPILLKNSSSSVIESLRGDLLLKASAEGLTYLNGPNEKRKLRLY
jgi:hypothetical protein